MSRIIAVGILLVLSSCAPNLEFKKSEITQPHRILVVVEDSKPSVAVMTPGSSVGVLFGAIGGAIAGALDSITLQPRVIFLQSSLRDWDFGSEFKDRFLKELHVPSAWEIKSSPGIIDAGQEKELIAYFTMVTNPPPSSKSADRGEEIRERAIRRATINKTRSYLEENKIDMLLRLRIDFYGLQGQTGNEDYAVRVTGSMIDTNYPPKQLWTHIADSEKRPDAKVVRIDFNAERQRSPEEVKKSLIDRAQYVAQALARDFD